MIYSILINGSLYGSVRGYHKVMKIVSRCVIHFTTDILWLADLIDESSPPKNQEGMMKTTVKYFVHFALVCLFRMSMYVYQAMYEA